MHPTALALDVAMDNPYFNPSAKQKSLIVTNTGDNLIAVEISVNHRSYDELGQESFSEPYEGMQVIPAQIVIAPGEEQVVNLRVVDTFPSENEVPLRLIVATLPVALESNNLNTGGTAGGLKMVYQVVRGLYLTPRGAKPDVVVGEISPDQDQVQLVLENQGSAHRIFYQVDIALNIGYRFSIGSKDLKGGINLLPGERRLIRFPKPQDWPTSSWTSARVLPTE